MKIKYDDKEATLSAAAIEHLHAYAREVCVSMRKADAAFADCWTQYAFWIKDNDVEPTWTFGGDGEVFPPDGVDAVFGRFDGTAFVGVARPVKRGKKTTPKEAP